MYNTFIQQNREQQPLNLKSFKKSHQHFVLQQQGEQAQYQQSTQYFKCSYNAPAASKNYHQHHLTSAKINRRQINLEQSPSVVSTFSPVNIIPLYNARKNLIEYNCNTHSNNNAGTLPSKMSSTNTRRTISDILKNSSKINTNSSNNVNRNNISTTGRNDNNSNSNCNNNNNNNNDNNHINEHSTENGNYNSYLHFPHLKDHIMNNNASSRIYQQPNSEALNGLTPIFPHDDGLVTNLTTDVYSETLGRICGVNGDTRNNCVFSSNISTALQHSGVNGIDDIGSHNNNGVDAGRSKDLNAEKSLSAKNSSCELVSAPTTTSTTSAVEKKTLTVNATSVLSTSTANTPSHVKSTSWKRTEPAPQLSTIQTLPLKKNKSLRRRSPTWMKLSTNTLQFSQEPSINSYRVDPLSSSTYRPGTLYSDVLFSTGSPCIVKVKMLPTNRNCNSNTSAPTTSGVNGTNNSNTLAISNSREYMTSTANAFGKHSSISENDGSDEGEIDGNGKPIFPSLQDFIACKTLNKPTHRYPSGSLSSHRLGSKGTAKLTTTAASVVIHGLNNTNNPNANTNCSKRSSGGGGGGVVNEYTNLGQSKHLYASNNGTTGGSRDQSSSTSIIRKESILSTASAKNYRTSSVRPLSTCSQMPLRLPRRTLLPLPSQPPSILTSNSHLLPTSKPSHLIKRHNFNLLTPLSDTEAETSSEVSSIESRIDQIAFSSESVSPNNQLNDVEFSEDDVIILSDLDEPLDQTGNSFDHIHRRNHSLSKITTYGKYLKQRFPTIKGIIVDGVVDISEADESNADYVDTDLIENNNDNCSLDSKNFWQENISTNISPVHDKLNFDNSDLRASTTADVTTACAGHCVPAVPERYFKPICRPPKPVNANMFVQVPSWNFLDTNTGIYGFPKFLYQFEDEQYLRAEKMALLGLKLALGNNTQQNKFRL